MDSKQLVRKILTLCLAVAIFATYSMVTLAASDKIVGELSISGKNTQGEIPAVTVNGEAAQNGRSIFSSSTIATSPNASAVISVAKVGKIELAPDTTVLVSFSEKGFSSDLITGKITALGVSENVSVKTPDGKIVKLNAGESAVAGQTQTQTQTNNGGGAWIWYALIFGGAAAAILIAATSDSNNSATGGNSIVVSPLR
jgi:hypothetical protein